MFNFQRDRYSRNTVRQRKEKCPALQGSAIAYPYAILKHIGCVLKGKNSDGLGRFPVHIFKGYRTQDTKVSFHQIKCREVSKWNL